MVDGLARKPGAGNKGNGSVNAPECFTLITGEKFD